MRANRPPAFILTGNVKLEWFLFLIPPREEGASLSAFDFAFGVGCTDRQDGLRGFPRNNAGRHGFASEKLLQLVPAGMLPIRVEMPREAIVLDAIDRGVKQSAPKAQLIVASTKNCFFPAMIQTAERPSRSSIFKNASRSIRAAAGPASRTDGSKKISLSSESV